MAEFEVAAARARDGGEAGNTGRGRGTCARAAYRLRDFITAADAEAVIRAVVAQALAGDPAAARLVLPRLPAHVVRRHPEAVQHLQAIARRSRRR
jgi:hypothetical protein